MRVWGIGWGGGIFSGGWGRLGGVVVGGLGGAWLACRSLLELSLWCCQNVAKNLGGLGILGGVRRIALDQLWQMFLRIAGVLLQVDILSTVGCPSSFRLLSGGGVSFCGVVRIVFLIYYLRSVITA